MMRLSVEIGSKKLCLNGMPPGPFISLVGGRFVMIATALQVKIPGVLTSFGDSETFLPLIC